jgi:O-acetyl-ADP-ribose deacetylase (regulator of RNase III)
LAREGDEGSPQVEVLLAFASIAFPAVSTGAYGFPADRAAKIAVGTVMDELERDASVVVRVIFCCFDARAAELHQARIGERERV